MQDSQSPYWLLFSRLAAVTLVAGTVVFVPLQSLEFTFPKLPFYALAGFLGLCALLGHPQRGSLSVLLTTWTGRLLLTSIVWILLSPFWSIAPLLSIVGAPPRYLGILVYSVAFAFTLTGIVLVQEQRTRRILTSSLVFAAALVSLYGILQMAHSDPLAGAWRSELFLGRVFSAIGQPNQLGQFLLLTLPFTALAIVDATPRRRSLLGILLLSGLVVLLGTGSRAAVIGLTASVAAAAIGMRRSARRVFSGHPMIIGLMLALLAGVAFLVFSMRFSVPTQEVLGMGVRPILWNAGARMIRDRPFGYGLETTGLVSPRYLSPALYTYESLTTKIDRLHSFPIDLWVTIGPVGLFVVCAFLLLLLFHLWRNRHEHPLLLACFCSLLGVHVALLVGFADLTTLVFSWFIAGMALGSLPRPVVEERRGRRSILVLFLFLLTGIAFIVSGFWTVVRFRRERAEALLQQGKFTEAAIAAERAAFPLDRQLLIESAEAGLLALEHAEDAGAKQYLSRTITDSLDGLDVLTNGQDGMVPTMRAWLAAVSRSSAAIPALAKEAIRLRPTDITVFRILAHAYELTGDSESESRMIQDITKLLPPAWWDALSPRGRILRKEAPWLEPLLQRTERP